SGGKRGPLRFGSYPELELRATSINWHGNADLLTLSSDGCEILDFKTGAPDDHHAFQLRVYALLWTRDAELNPSGLIPKTLRGCYRHGGVLVDPLTASDLAGFERDLVARRDAASVAVEAKPPEARPKAVTCRYCTVRHMCDEYWSIATIRRLAAEA